MGTVNLLDENLVRLYQFRNGNAGAFAAIIQLHYNARSNYGTRFTIAVERIKRCIRNLFLSPWKNKATVNAVSFVKCYPLTLLRTKLNKVLTKKEKHSFTPCASGLFRD